MVRIGVRQLRQHAGRCLCRVGAAETVAGSVGGNPVALLVPPCEGLGSTTGRGWHTARAGTPRVSNELEGVKVIRGFRRVNAEALPEVRALLAELDLIPLTGDVVEEASVRGQTLPGSVNAIHLARTPSIRADICVHIADAHHRTKDASAIALQCVRPRT
jgi:antitoxin (DNA-binding transcriptional repressor) of toxin-antitoxin stability system